MSSLTCTLLDVTRESLYVPISEIAEAFGRSPARIYQLVAEGRIPAVRDGRKVLIPREAYQAWLAGQTIAALAGTADSRTAARAEAVTPG